MRQTAGFFFFFFYLLCMLNHNQNTVLHKRKKQHGFTPEGRICKSVNGSIDIIIVLTTVLRNTEACSHYKGFLLLAHEDLI